MKNKLYAALGICVLIAVFALLPGGVSRRIRFVADDVFSPFASFLHKAPEYAASLLRDRGSLAAENRQMAVELELARYEVLRLRHLEDENRKLRHILKLTRALPHELVPGRVAERDISGWWRKIRLDIGRERGVEPGLAVVSGSGLVGRTDSVSSHRSEVLLLIDPSCSVSARVSESDAFGIVRGKGFSSRDGLLCRMEFIARGARILPGNEVVTSGLGGVYPAGIVIGRVDRVYTDSSGLYLNADIVPATDFRSLDIVLVVLSDED